MTASTETSQVCSFLRPVDLLAMDGTVRASAADLHGVKVFLACGIARPGDFEALLKSLGARVVGRQFIQDHRPLPESALKRAARAGAELVLSSEKDAARMVGLVPWRHLLALRCEVRICAGEALLDAALARALNRCG